MPRVALAFNLARPDLVDGRPLDVVAELDTEPTIAALVAALETGGHEVVRVEADENLWANLQAARPDVVFNVAEGIGGESRESVVPAICEHLGIPYTGSTVLTTALCLDKARTKEILVQYALDTPPWRVVSEPRAPVMGLRFPLIVKLLHEGSSMGLAPESVVDDGEALRDRIAYAVATYRQPVLVEEFIEGREFTVGLVGNDEPALLPIVETVFPHPRGVNLFDPDPPLLAMVAGRYLVAPPARPVHRAVCPALLDEELAERVRDTALRAFRALGCRDWCRIDMRLGSDGRLYVLELNPIAGLDPSYLLPRAAAAAGWSYPRLINAILDACLARMAPRSHVSRPSG